MALRFVPLGLSIMRLIGRTESEAPAFARALVVRAKTEIGDEALRADLIELIETVIIYKLGRLSREEIQTMLQVHDLRETRVYQEAKEEGRQEGLHEGMAHAIHRLAARKTSAEEIAAILEIDVATVHRVLKNRENGST